MATIEKWGGLLHSNQEGVFALDEGRVWVTAAVLGPAVHGPAQRLSLWGQGPHRRAQAELLLQS